MLSESKELIGITGANGVLGRIISAELSARGIAHTAFNGDVRSRNNVSQWFSENSFDRLIHLAACVSIEDVERDPMAAFLTNVIGSVNVFEAGLSQAVPPWVFLASTSHVYKSASKAISENDAINPQNNYAVTKIIAEKCATYFSNTCGLKICVGRIFSYFDASQRPPYLYPSILARLRSHDCSKPFLVTNGNDIRDISTADSIAKHIVELSQKRFVGTVNIGKGSGTRVVDFVKQFSGSNISVVADQKRTPVKLVADTSVLRSILGE